jgi:phosphoglycolate phosphatase-like HAD superfamily hydrolase
MIMLLLMLTLVGCALAPASDPLPSWNEGETKQAIVQFVADVTRSGSADFVPAAERIAVFDNDGTLWSEQPVYFQFAFTLDRVKALAPRHPEWSDQSPFNAAVKGDFRALAAAGKKGMFELVIATHTGMATEDFSRTVTDWIASARHPRFDRQYTDLVYQPMLELLRYLRKSGFKTYIVSGGEVEFMRPWVERAYGIPPEQVIGTTFVTEYSVRADGSPAVVSRAPKIEFVDDGPGKPVAIQRVIGRRPLLAFGNSDGDHQMLQWTAAGSGRRLVGLVHHTDAVREWAYDRDSHVGRLDKALDEGHAKGWAIVDMKRDWKRVYPFQWQ